MIKRIIKIVLVVCCMVCIFMFSSDTADESSKKSNGLIVKIAEVITGGKLSDKEKEKTIDSFVFIVRKTAHFSIYFVLGFLLLNLVLEYKSFGRVSILFAFFVAVLYACSDEIHQLFVAGRSGEVRDVLIDSCGSFMGIMFYSLIYKLRRKLHE